MHVGDARSILARSTLAPSDIYRPSFLQIIAGFPLRRGYGIRYLFRFCRRAFLEAISSAVLSSTYAKPLRISVKAKLDQVEIIRRIKLIGPIEPKPFNVGFNAIHILVPP